MTGGVVLESMPFPLKYDQISRVSNHTLHDLCIFVLNGRREKRDTVLGLVIRTTQPYRERREKKEGLMISSDFAAASSSTASFYGFCTYAAGIAGEVLVARSDAS